MRRRGWCHVRGQNERLDGVHGWTAELMELATELDWLGEDKRALQISMRSSFSSTSISFCSPLLILIFNFSFVLGLPLLILISNSVVFINSPNSSFAFVCLAFATSSVVSKYPIWYLLLLFFISARHFPFPLSKWTPHNSRCVIFS